MAIPDVGLHEGGGVVDAVADHGHLVAVGLEFAHDLGLALGQHAGADVVDPELVGDVPGRGRVVAGDQYRVRLGRAQPCDGLDRVGADLVAEGDDPQRAGVGGDRDDGASGGLQPRHRLGQRREVDAAVGEELRAPDEHLPALDAGGHAEPGDRGELLGGGHGERALLGRADRGAVLLAVHGDDGALLMRRSEVQGSRASTVMASGSRVP
jgi:hypothetical protein